MKRVFWILFTPFAVVFLIYAFSSLFIAPHFKKWALAKIESYSSQNLPVMIHAEGMSIKLLRPAVSLENITITAKGDLAKALPEMRIASATAYLDFIKILVGRAHLSAVVVDTPAVHLNIDPFLEDDTPPKELPIDQLFSILEELPLQRVLLQNVLLHVESKKYGLNVTTSEAGLLLTNMGKNLTAKAAIPKLQAQLKDWRNFEGSFDTHLYLTRQSLRVIQLGVHLNESELLGRGEFTRVAEIFMKPSGVLSFSAKANLSEVYEEIKKNRPDWKIPPISGSVETETEVRFNGLKDIRGKADITTKALMLEKIELGDARIQGEFHNRVVRLSEIKLQHPAGEAHLTGAEIELGHDFSFKSKIKVEELDLQKLFVSLDLGSIPVGVGLKGEIPCSGRVRPEFSVQCDNVTLEGKDLWVKSGSEPQDLAIVNVDSLSASGSVNINMHNVSYKAQLNVKDNVGTTDGVIDFAKGFNINFKTKRLDWKNVKNLANLKMEGSTSIEGFTKGDSNAATFDMNVNARDFIFEDFKLGNLIAVLKYRSGHLLFEDIAGSIGKTQYLGDLDVDLNHNQLKGDFSSPSTELPDVANVLDRLYHFPMALQGKGAARAHVQGPLNFWKMNYNIESAFKGVSIGPENFETLTFNASATNGNIKADKIVLQKGPSTVKVTGGISSSQEFNLFADGQKWKLEESDVVSSFTSNMSGNVNFSAELRGTPKTPLLTIKGSISDTYLEDQDIPNSNFVLKVNGQSFGGDLRLFGDKVQGQFQIPFTNGTVPLVIKINTNAWNYAALLALVGGTNLISEYESLLTSQMDLRSESGHFSKVSGKVHIDTFFLKRGNLSFRNSQAMDLVANDGLMTIKNFNLQGPNSYLTVTGENFSAERLNLTCNSQVDLRLLQVFFPFLEDLGGPLRLSATLSGSITKPQILGSTSLNNVFLRIKGFPHPIEKISSEVVFSQSRILVNSLRGNLAGGTLNGEGGVSLNGVRDIPTSIRLHLDNVTLNVPDKIRTSGSAELLFSGKWFPFVLSGTYQVNAAQVEKEFTEDGGGLGASIRQSRYLPKVLRQSAFVPVVLDLQIILNRGIVVKNSMIDGSVTGNLQVKGPPDNPLLFGRITTEKNSKLIFKDKIFDIQSGVIDFKDPNEINPDLYLSATSRINEYDVMILAQGASKNPTIRLTSVPPLSEQDIISLIALGMTGTNMDQNVQSRNQAEQTGAEIGGAVLAKPLNRELEKTLGLNLQVSSQYDSTRNISVPKVTLSRRLTEKMKVSGSRPVGDSNSYDVKLEYQLNNNLNAIGSYESRDTESENNQTNTQSEYQSIFGLDLEFKREFK
ncbi:translocation/assembly module TamB domain-containing protein [Bdellovibrio sp. HCB2-146]|uniref:translocation/assembly module TamB domain-containing protein n=1 Tax=Bdellovibrio sp. HCB2-146 TaxID=3394362 RepID=UPI0039BC7CEF